MSGPARAPLARPARAAARALALALASASLLAATGAGCAGARHRHAEGFDPRAPLRIAVLPFADVADGDSIFATPFAAGIDLAPLLSDDAYAREQAPRVLREKVAANLQRAGFQIMSLAVVDEAIARHALPVPPTCDEDREQAARGLGAAFGADAVLFGAVTAWDRSFYLVESVVEVGVHVDLRDAFTGALLFTSEVSDYESAGISKLPAAYSPDGAIQSTVGESWKGLRNKAFQALSDDVAREVAAGLGPPAEERAAAAPPQIGYVAHDADGPLAPGVEVVVVAQGDPGLRASFRVGAGPFAPMTESCPGGYRGTARLGPSHDLAATSITVRMVSRSFLASTMTVPRSARPRPRFTPAEIEAVVRAGSGGPSG